MKRVIVLLGATGVGKTDLSLKLAKYHNCPIISADSRQIYKGLEIGTAAPSPTQLNEAKHYLIGNKEPTDYFSASEFEQDALTLIQELHKQHDTLIVTGGSMMYIDALCKGIDDIPTIDQELRKDLYTQYEISGLDPIRQQLKTLDPLCYNQVDLKNHKRVIHALEVCLMTGKPYSSFRTNTIKQRPFEISKIGLLRDRQDLYTRINKRVDSMIEQGLIEEVKKYHKLKHLNALNTVGYKELFKYLDGEWTLDFAIEKIKQNTRIYSRKQMTWFKRDTSIHWINLSVLSEIEALKEVLLF